jgi:quercetin dioxygenase-like cupin family protein
MQRLSTLMSASLALSLSAGLAFAQEEDVFPKVVHNTSTAVNTVPGDFQLTTLVLEFPPGAWTPLHMHGGDGLVTVLEGEMTLEVLGQDAQTYGPGDQWKEYVAKPHRAGNETDETARLVVTFILPADVPTTIPLE